MKKKKKKKNFLQRLRVVAVIGKVSFSEILRDKVLYNVLFCGFILFSLGLLLSHLSVIRPERVILDFGLSSLGISCSLIAVLMGSGLLKREFERKTAFMALCRPISKTQFILGKYLGLIAILSLNALFFIGVYLGLLRLYFDSFDAFYSTTFVIALFFASIESFILASLVLLFSTWSTPSLTVIFSFGLYLIGNALSQIQFLLKRMHASWLQKGLLILLNGLPHFEPYHLGTLVTYRLPIAWSFVGFSIGYAFFMIAFCLFISRFLIEHREV